MISRIQHIDMARGIGILLVVFGHNWIVLHEKGELFRMIFSFHMPMFFFLSGLFYKPEIKLSGLMVDKLDSVLKPYFVSLSILGAVCIFFQGYSPIMYLLGVIYGNGNTILWPPLWFLTNLWVVFIFSWLFIRAIHIESAKTIYQLIALIFLLIAGYYLSFMFWGIPVHFSGEPIILFGEPLVLWGLPFSIDIVLLTSFYFLMGFLIKDRVLNFKHNNSCFILSLITFFLLHYFFDYTIDFNARIYSNLLISTLEAVSGIYIGLCLASLIERYAILSKVIVYIGSGSLFVFIFHFEIQRSVFEILQATIGGTPYVSAIISFVLGSAIPLLIWEIVKRNDYLAMFWLPLKANKSLKRRQSVSLSNTKPHLTDDRQRT